MEQQQKKKIFAVLFAVAVSAVLFLGDDGAAMHRHEHRSLSIPSFFDPDTAEPLPNINSTLTVYLTPTPNFNPAYSIFKTDVLQRYGSGRFKFLIKENARIDYSCKTMVLSDENAPCLVVNRGRHFLTQHITCNYPQCKTMITNDERCHTLGYDVREYYSANIPNTGYLPLGPRYDAWSSFQRIRAFDPEFSIKRASQRKYAFNAIFSKDTNKGRAELARVIEGRQEEEREGNNDGEQLPIFTTMTEKWHREVNNPRYGQLNTHSYVEVVLDSVFTLSPAGHNPECFRLFEAIELGSIPVLIRDDLYITRTIHPCRSALMHWYDAPMLVLDSWHDLYPAVEELMANGKALDAMQAKLGVWYDEYMHKVVREFEDYMIELYRPSEEESLLAAKEKEEVARAESSQEEEVTEASSYNFGRYPQALQRRATRMRMLKKERVPWNQERV